MTGAGPATDDAGVRRIPLATGIELAVHEFGAGEPVLLLHAWSETHRSFQRLVPLLPRTWHLIVPDQRGVGDSAQPDSGYALTDFAADTIGLLDALGLHSAWLVGTSSGGYVAQQVAVDHPSRVRGLVLIGSPADLQRPLPVALAEALDSFHDPVNRDDIGRLNTMLGGQDRIPADFLDDMDTAALTIPARVWKEWLAELFAAEPPIRQGRISRPTLLLWGGAEEVLPAEQLDTLRAAIDEVTVRTYEGTGHLVLWEQPERVAADVTAFIGVSATSVSPPSS